MTPPEPPSEEAKPKNKGGRPKGAKNRPKWMLEALKKQPKRPRGRPPGPRKPKTLEDLIAQAKVAPVVQKPKIRKPKKPVPEGRVPYFTRLKQEDPEKLKAIVSKGGRSGAKTKGAPNDFTTGEWAVVCNEAYQIAKKIMKTMDKDGSLPENPIAREAMQAAVEMLAQPSQAKDRLAVIRTLLEWNLAKPAATSNVNLRTAEDFLDEIADKE